MYASSCKFVEFNGCKFGWFESPGDAAIPTLGNGCDGPVLMLLLTFATAVIPVPTPFTKYI